MLAGRCVLHVPAGGGAGAGVRHPLAHHRGVPRHARHLRSIQPRRRLRAAPVSRCAHSGVKSGRKKIQDSGFRIQHSGFRIQDSGFRIQDSGFRIQDSGFRILGLGSWILDLGSWVLGLRDRTQGWDVGLSAYSVELDVDVDYPLP